MTTARSSYQENSMKRFITILLLLLPLVTREGMFDRNHYRNLYEAEMEQRRHKLLLGVMWTETRLAAVVETPTSRREDAVGVLQIRPGMVHYLNMVGHSFNLSDRGDSVRSVEMFFAFQEMMNPEYDFEYGCHIWNAGHNRVDERWHLTDRYRQEAKHFTNQI